MTGDTTKDAKKLCMMASLLTFVLFAPFAVNPLNTPARSLWAGQAVCDLPRTQRGL